MSPRKLRIFLCHASDDKPAVRKLYASLKSLPWIDPWLDEENLLPGQDWNLEIEKAIRDADAIIICISKVSVAKEGYVNKEIRRALDIAEEKPEGAIYVIPLRLDDCAPSFEQLKKLQWVDYFTPNAHERLLKALHLRANGLKLFSSNIKDKQSLLTRQSTKDSREDGKSAAVTGSTPPKDFSALDLDHYRFIQLPSIISEISYWISKYPITNAQYERFFNSPDFRDEDNWKNFPKYDVDRKRMDDLGTEGLGWYQKKIKEYGYLLKVEPEYWRDPKIGISLPKNPVVGITWFEANAYCKWLFANWNKLAETFATPTIKPQIVRLPLQNEWEAAAGGAHFSSGMRGVGAMLQAASRSRNSNAALHGVRRLYEWQANCADKDCHELGLCTITITEFDELYRASRTNTSSSVADRRTEHIGFRVFCISK